MRRFEGEELRQTRIVATVGLCPEGSTWPDFLTRLVNGGVDVLRVNMSHADPDYAKEGVILDWANAPVVEEDPPRVAVLVDLQGPKARIGTLPGEGLELLPGERLTFAPPEAAGEVAEGVRHVPAPAKMLAALCRSLDGQRRAQSEQDQGGPELGRLRFGDGEVEVKVSAWGEGVVHGQVTAAGHLGSRKGLTLFGADIDLDPFSEKDRRDLAFALERGVDLVAVSFVRQASDIERVKAFIAERVPTPERRPGVIAKIETLSAVEGIDAILAASDGIMIARGDLGMQLGLAEVPAVQKRLAIAGRRINKPVIVATQMLESMIHNLAPTRAEVTDVFNAVLDGGDAVMLSGETSVGAYPCQTVEMIDRLVRRAEQWRAAPESLKRDRKTMRRDAGAQADDKNFACINEELALTAVQLGEEIAAAVVICSTRTGGTPRRLSRYRPELPVVALCSDERVCRRLLLHYGVHPILARARAHGGEGFGQLIEIGARVAREDLGLSSGSLAVFTAGVDWPRGGTNSLRVARI